MTRTFIALGMDESLQSFLSEIIHSAEQDLPDLRWVNRAGIHLTLAFLGELTDEQLAAAIQASEVATQKATPFVYRLKGLGAFGSLQQPRVIWVGVGDQPSAQIQGCPLRPRHPILPQQLA